MKCSTNCNNCEPDDGKFLNVDVLKDVLESDSVESVIVMEENNGNETITNSNNFSPVSNSTPADNKLSLELETCSVVYFAGYLVKKCFEINLTRNNHYLNDESLLLLLYKSYDNVESTRGLKAPSNQLHEIVNICLDVFENNFQFIKSSKKFLFQLKEKADKKIYLKFPNLLKTTCLSHYDFIINLLFRTKIFKEFKWENAKIGKRSSIQNIDKLRVLQNK